MTEERTEAIRVAIVEDQPRLREMFGLLIAADASIAGVSRYASMEEALAGLGRAPVDVVLADIGLPGMSGIEGVRRLRALRPETQVLMLTVHDDDEHVFDAIRAGASGYLLKDTPPARVLEAIAEVYAGGAPMTPAIARKVVATFRAAAPAEAVPTILSPREKDVLRLLAEGHSYKTAAVQLGLGLDTVRYHIRHIYEKLHVHSKSEAVLKATRARLLP